MGVYDARQSALITISYNIINCSFSWIWSVDPPFLRPTPGAPTMACGPVMAGWSLPGSWRVGGSPQEAARDWRHQTWTSDAALTPSEPLGPSHKAGGFMCFTIPCPPQKRKTTIDCLWHIYIYIRVSQSWSYYWEYALFVVVFADEPLK